MTFDKVLVTGGAGFIGSHTVDALLKEGKEVWVLDDLSTGSTRNLRTWKKNRKFHFMKNTITQYRVLESVTKKVEAIMHLAAVVSPYLSVKKPELVNEVNVSGTLNLLRAAFRNKVQRVVFASSSSVYGNQNVLPISEDNPLHPVTPYGASKLSGESYCGAYYQTYGLSTVSLRYFNVYGERQRANPYSGVIAIFAEADRTLNVLRTAVKRKIKRVLLLLHSQVHDSKVSVAVFLSYHLHSISEASVPDFQCGFRFLGQEALVPQEAVLSPPVTQDRMARKPPSNTPAETCNYMDQTPKQCQLRKCTWSFA